MDERIKAIEGWMAESELAWLYETAKKVPPGEIILEIGAWMGRSSAAIYDGARDRALVVSVDTWQGSPDEPHELAQEVDLLSVYMANMREMGFDPQPYEGFEDSERSPQYLVGDSLQVCELVPDNSVSWLFYDGRHTKTGENLDSWMPKMKEHSLLTGHDYFCFYRYIQQEIHKRFYVHEIDDSIWVKYMGLEKPDWY